MDPMITAGLISAGGSMLQGLFGQSSAQASMDFQKEVLQNRNQWMVQDLKKAGLNPILAAGATSSGSASGAQAHIDNPGEKAVSSAMQYKMADIAKDNQIMAQRKTEADINLSNALSTKAYAEANAVVPQVKLTNAKVGQTHAQTEYIGTSADQNRQNIQESIERMREIDARVSKLRSDIQTAEKERAFLVAKAREAYSSADRHVAGKNLAVKDAELIELKKQTQQWITESERISSNLKGLGIPKATAEAEHYRKPANRFMIENVPGYHKYFNK